MVNALAARLSTSLKMRLHRDLIDRRFDHRFGVETCGRHWQSELDLRGENAPFGIEYEPTPRLVFERMVRALDIDFERFVFIDLGSGKGRMIALASERPFKRVDGIELSPVMHAIALKNIEALGNRGEKVKSHNVDAARFEFSVEPFVIFAFNPFQEPVMRRVLANLGRSLREYPREGYVLYLNARHKNLFDDSSCFAELPRSQLQKFIDRVVSPWPMAIYRTV